MEYQMRLCPASGEGIGRGGDLQVVKEVLSYETFVSVLWDVWGCVRVCVHVR